MSEWKEVRLGDIVTVKSGYAYKGKYISNKGKNILLGMGCVSYNDKFLYSGARAYDEDCDERYCAKAGDIVLATRQQSDSLPILAMPAIIPDSLFHKKIIVGTNLYLIKNDSDIDNHFLFWLLKTPNYVNYISSVKTGTTVRMVTKKDVENYTFNCPSKEERDTISNILWGIDAKIETNNKLNEKLEEMAQAIFKSWFVDFEPFKDKPFHDTELGMIPERWEVCCLGNFITEIETGKREKGGAVNFGIPSIGAEKIERISYYDFSSEKYISFDFYNNLKKGKIQDCDVLLYKDGAYTGKSTMFIDDFPYKKCAINEHVFILRTNRKKYQSFLYLLINQKKIKELIHSLASSKAAQPGLNQKEVSSVMFIKPSEDILNNFENMIFPLLKHIVHNLKENRSLASLRDTLLPRLMSGELIV